MKLLFVKGDLWSKRQTLLMGNQKPLLLIIFWSCVPEEIWSSGEHFQVRGAKHSETECQGAHCYQQFMEWGELFETIFEMGSTEILSCTCARGVMKASYCPVRGTRWNPNQEHKANTSPWQTILYPLLHNPPYIYICKHIYSIILNFLFIYFFTTDSVVQK